MALERIKKRYVVDLMKMGATCEANYYRIQKLMPTLDDGQEHAFLLENSAAGIGRMHLRVMENHRYTTIIKIWQTTPLNDWLIAPGMVARMYHDANLAEVQSYQGHQYFQGIYPYPNENMYHSNEKEQLNHFLADWLAHCITYGISEVDKTMWMNKDTEQ